MLEQNAGAVLAAAGALAVALAVALSSPRRCAIFSSSQNSAMNLDFCKSSEQKKSSIRRETPITESVAQFSSAIKCPRVTGLSVCRSIANLVGD